MAESRLDRPIQNSFVGMGQEAFSNPLLISSAMVTSNAEHFVDDVGVDGCRLIGKGRGLEELGEVGLEWWRDW